MTPEYGHGAYEWRQGKLHSTVRRWRAALRAIVSISGEQTGMGGHDDVPDSSETAVAFIWRKVGMMNSSRNARRGSSEGASLKLAGAGLLMVTGAVATACQE